ncbi:hypothetical protein PRZ48_009036 [Zasmidium cellare]|uniref:Zn(2)-C6 fungal-type domain-containing protein n=1 Tax=Zasmidium cellare TaxID=395010 RepID=A0ABR0EH82_ZASCE|nr:hypothetical protein PRZ48_009036 [Zasmidium cellare]
MVAVARRCATCKARKIKCDQDWPACGQCKSRDKECPGSPRKVKFMPLRTLPEKKTKSKDNSVQIAERSENDIRTRDHPNHLTGYRLLDYEHVMSPCLAWSVSKQLVQTIAIDNDGSSFFASCSYIEDVPRLLDSSPALTATIACCLDACQRTRLFPRCSRTLDARLYGRALTTINEALERCPSQTSTFLAVVLLARMESLLCSRQLAQLPSWSVHASGICDLLRSRGAFDPGDRAGHLAVLESAGPIIGDSVLRGEDCFLASSEWQEGLRPWLRVGEQGSDSIVSRVFAGLAQLPKLLASVRRYRRRIDDVVGAIEVAELAISLHEELQAIDRSLERADFPSMAIGPPLWLDIDAPVSKVYQRPDPDNARAMTWNAILAIIVSKVLILLKSSPVHVEGVQRLHIADLQADARSHSERVWMLSEEARRKGVTTYYFYPGALCSTYEFATNDNERDWIVELMNDIMSDTWLEEVWTHESVRGVSLKLAGKLD